MKKHILVFDSGLGGTTVLQDIQKKLPDYTYSYALDNSAFPYSNKSDAFLLEHIHKLFDYLIPLCQPDLVVIACNTASTLILDQLRKHFPMPFVGVVPAIKPAAALSKTRVIGLLATPATLSRDYIDRLSAEYAEDCQILSLGSQRLVEIAEEKMQGKLINISDIENELQVLYTQPLYEKIDIFILGCTHFPALKEELVQAWPHPALWIDSGEAIARRVEELCKTLHANEHKAANTLYLSAKNESQLKLNALQRFNISHCHIMEID